jgi:DNA mismatch repair protein MutS
MSDTKQKTITPNEDATPLMKQYLAIKAQHQDAILFFRMGDFYEMFYDDAKVASEVLGLTLTARAHGKSAMVPLAGFPYHALDTYLTKMVKAGHRVAICEQTEDPKLAKIVVQRGVTEIVTPGTALHDHLLDSQRNNFLLAVHLSGKVAGLAQVDFSTGEFLIGEYPLASLRENILMIQPAELLISSEHHDWLKANLSLPADLPVTTRDGWQFSFDFAYESLTRHFQTLTLKGFGCDDLRVGISAAGAALSYLKETKKNDLQHLRSLRRITDADYLTIDAATRRNLELIEPLRIENKSATLLGILNRTRTAMGARRLVQWIVRPLREARAINERLDAVEQLIDRRDSRQALSDQLRGMGDLERLLAKVATARANARELQSVRAVQQRIPELRRHLHDFEAAALKKIHDQLQELTELAEEIGRALVDEPPLSVTDGGVIRQGYSEELDRIREMAYSGKSWIAKLQASERERTGIASLKVGFTKVFGYYIEVSNANLAKVPESYIRKQTLVNAERFITPELKEYEEQVLQAEERMVALEYELFDKLRQHVAMHVQALQENARQIATLDCLLALAEVAADGKYCRPQIEESEVIDIRQGRHPVVEKLLPFGEAFVPNDAYLDGSTDQILIITGPNMAGKSTYLRQVALIVLMAQMGSFVPAASARIGLADKIFTRVGASDNLAGGESTFLVEMNEAANILHNATPKSLVVLDEIGRGTSTFDGLSIAWAVAEYLHDTANRTARTLFATHYHELTELAGQLPRVKNYNILVKEWGDQVVFLRKIAPGGCDHSYGIQVAQLAGLPKPVINRAKEVLSTLEHHSLGKEVQHAEGSLKGKAQGLQLDIFEEQEKWLRQEIAAIDLDTISPLQAFQKLLDLKKRVNGGN